MHGMPDTVIRQKLLEQDCAPDVIAELLGSASPAPTRAVAPFSDIVHRSPVMTERHTRPEPALSTGDARSLSEPDMDEKIETFIADEIMTTEQPAPEAPVKTQPIAVPASQPAPTVQPETKAQPEATEVTATEVPAAVQAQPESKPAVTSVEPPQDTPQAAPAVIAATVANPSKVKRGHKHTFAKYALGSALFLLLIAVGAFAVFPREAPQATARPAATAITIRDQNYTLVLPVSWRKGSDYVNGGGVNVFYQSSDTATKVSRMAVFVTPANSSQADHVTTQIVGLQQNGGTAQVNTKMPLTLGPNTGLLTEVTATAASNPSDITHYLFLACTYGATNYNIDVMIPAEQWNNTHNAIITSLQSFRPVNKAITMAQPKAN